MDRNLQPLHESRVQQEIRSQRLAQKYIAEGKFCPIQLRKYLNEVLLDQIPNLSYMLRSLEELSIMNVPTHLTTNPFVVQQIPIIATEICRGQDWDELARQQL